MVGPLCRFPGGGEGWQEDHDQTTDYRSIAVMEFCSALKSLANFGISRVQSRKIATATIFILQFFLRPSADGLAKLILLWIACISYCFFAKRR